VSSKDFKGTNESVQGLFDLWNKVKKIKLNIRVERFLNWLMEFCTNKYRVHFVSIRAFGSDDQENGGMKPRCEFWRYKTKIETYRESNVYSIEGDEKFFEKINGNLQAPIEKQKLFEEF